MLGIVQSLVYVLLLIEQAFGEGVLSPYVFIVQDETSTLSLTLKVKVTLYQSPSKLSPLLGDTNITPGLSLSTCIVLFVLLNMVVPFCNPYEQYHV